MGADIESICGKCGDVWHVVVAKVGSQIAKVQCKQCGGLHRHRPPGGTAKRAAPKRRTAAKKSARSMADGTPPPDIKADPSRPARSYSARENYTVADAINHPKFGLGVVQAVAEGKVTVSFESGPRVLAQAKSESKLARPNNTF